MSITADDVMASILKGRLLTADFGPSSYANPMSDVFGLTNYKAIAFIEGFERADITSVDSVRDGIDTHGNAWNTKYEYYAPPFEQKLTPCPQDDPGRRP